MSASPLTVRLYSASSFWLVSDLKVSFEGSSSTYLVVLRSKYYCPWQVGIIEPRNSRLPSGPTLSEKFIWPSNQIAFFDQSSGENEALQLAENQVRIATHQHACSFVHFALPRDLLELLLNHLRPMVK
jgi:hypothetical protein